jgi:hypothetical protein
MNVYTYFYYHLAEFISRVRKDNPYPGFSAVIFLTAVILINVENMFLVVCIFLKTGIELPDFFNIPFLPAIILIVSIAILQLLYIKCKKINIEMLREQNKNRTRKQFNIGVAVSFLLFLITNALFVILIILRNHIVYHK